LADKKLSINSSVVRACGTYKDEALPEIEALIVDGKFIITFADPLNEAVGPLLVASLSAI
jgi:hypothetical protein